MPSGMANMSAMMRPRNVSCNVMGSEVATRWATDVLPAPYVPRSPCTRPTM